MFYFQLKKKMISLLDKLKQKPEKTEKMKKRPLHPFTIKKPLEIEAKNPLRLTRLKSYNTAFIITKNFSIFSIFSPGRCSDPKSVTKSKSSLAPRVQ